MVAALTSLGWFGWKRSDPEAVKAAAFKALEGAAQYSVKMPYSDAVEAVYLGFDPDGNVTTAVALRKFKSFKRITAMVVARRDGKKFVLKEAGFPDIHLIKGERKQKAVLSVVKDMPGRTLRGEDGTVHPVDAVTGATRYTRQMFLTFDVMAKALMETMAAPPDWPRQEMPK
jgi:hypothetical protein